VLGFLNLALINLSVGAAIILAIWLCLELFSGTSDKQNVPESYARKRQRIAVERFGPGILLSHTPEQNAEIERLMGEPQTGQRETEFHTKDSGDGEQNLPSFSIANAPTTIPVSQKAFASMMLERERLKQATQNGKTMSEAEQKALVISEFLLGSEDDEPLIKQQKMTLEAAKDIPAVGKFTFGDITVLLTGNGLSRGDVIRFLQDIQSSRLSPREASDFLEDCREWENTKRHTSLSKSDFFAKRLAERKSQHSNPSHN
jgi:hypothetical protein